MFNFFKKSKKQKSVAPESNIRKDEIYQMLFEMMSMRAPSDQFVSGAVFDISRQYRDAFMQAIRSNDLMLLLKRFKDAYMLFLNNPQVVGSTPDMVKRDNDDTNPQDWNLDLFDLQSGDSAVLLFMPVQNETLTARIVGIIFSDKGDGYYYCMLNKNESIPSNVIRNKSIFGIEPVGEVSGIGFELMHDFLNCIEHDFYESIDT